MSTRLPQNEKDLLAALVRLLEQDEAPGTVARTRQQTHAEPAADQAEEPVGSPASLIAAQDADGARLPSPQGRYIDPAKRVAVATEAPACSEGEVTYEAGWRYPDRLPRRAPRLGLVAAVVGLALAGCAGLFGYFAWLSEPHRAAEPLTQNRGLGEEGKKTLGGTNENDASATAAAVPHEAEIELKPPSAPQLLPGTGEASYGVAATQRIAQTPPVTGTTSTADARKVRSETVPVNEPASAPAIQVVESPPPAATASTPPAAPLDQPRLAPDAATPAPGISTSASREPSGPSPPAAAAGKTYVVQLSSQRSEKAAQATAQALQIKYQKIFGERRPFIRRSDLREKGVYFRALVGTFATIEEANQFCGNLKKAGGECVVQKN